MPPFGSFAKPWSEIEANAPMIPRRPRRRRQLRGFTYAEISALVGPAHEERFRAEPLVDSPPTEAQNLHDGWRWGCGCSAFIRTDDAKRYVWMRCGTHRRPAHRTDDRPNPFP